MSSKREYRQARGEGIWDSISSCLVAFLFVLGTSGLLTLVASPRVEAQGSGSGPLPPATVIVGDGVGLPGEEVPITISFTTLPGGTGIVEAATVTTDIIYDGDLLELALPEGCALDPRLDVQSGSFTFPADQPDPPLVRLRIGVLPPLVTPVPSFPPGNLATCNFLITENNQIGDEILLAQDVDRVQVAQAAGQGTAAGGGAVVLCGTGSLPDEIPCGIVDGIITVGSSATPTNTPVPTDTPTNTPVPATPTNTPVPATPTNTPLPVFGGGSNCSIVSGGESNTWGSLIFLLTIPALMLWGRRRR